VKGGKDVWLLVKTDKDVMLLVFVDLVPLKGMVVGIDFDIKHLFSYMVCDVEVYASSQLECVLPSKIDLPLCTWL
jgi:hypothetical protein